jgi:hypothetical protein
LLDQTFTPEEAVRIDLLNPAVLADLSAYPENLYAIAEAAHSEGKIIVIDKVQPLGDNIS